MTATPAAPEQSSGLETRLREREARFRASPNIAKLYLSDDADLDAQPADALAKARVALEAIQQRANERHGSGFIAERDTVYAMHAIARAAMEAMGK